MNKILKRQLKHLNLENNSGPSAEDWKNLLRQIDETYTQMEKDRYLLERSLELSSNEMSEIVEQLREERAELQKTHDELEKTNRVLRRTNEFFKNTVDHMLGSLKRGANASELLVYLDQVQGQFKEL